jgi:predicted MFS family arabinose efflux permease
MVKSVLVLPSIRTIDFGTFVCSTGLSAVFFMIPIQLAEQGWISSELWQIYLPMLLSGGLIMVGAAIVAETKNRFREVMFLGVGFLIASVFCLAFFHKFQENFLLIAGLFLFFMGFNVFEPLFPSLVTRLTNPTTKGTASGVYNFCQFVGHFAGAAIAGIFYSTNLFFLLGLLLMINLCFLFMLYKNFSNPIPRKKADTEKIKSKI